MRKQLTQWANWFFVVAGWQTIACNQAHDHVCAAKEELYGGKFVDAKLWPSVVGINEVCSGVLVHPRLVLYAGHCGVDIESIQTEQGQVTTERCEAHPQAAPTTPAFTVTTESPYVDIAYCTLAKPASVQVAPILGACEKDLLTPGRQLLLLGHGPTTADGGFSPLNAVEVDITRRVGTELEVGKEGVGTCRGDSGGPAFAKSPDGAWKLVGILSSASTPYCQPKHAYYVRLGEHLSWIEQTTSISLEPLCPKTGGQPPPCLAGT